MKFEKHVYALVASTFAFFGMATLASAAPPEPTPVGKNGMLTGTSYQNDVSLPLYYLPAREEEDEAVALSKAHEGPANPMVPFHHTDSADPVVQHTMTPAPLIPSPILNFAGIPFPGVGCNCAPPDTNGEVGETQYLQMVNEGFQVFDKATGASLLGPQSITVQGIGESRTGADAGASASLFLGNTARIYLNYDAKLRANLQSHQGTLGLEVKW
jgi:hypothetical protein